MDRETGRTLYRRIYEELRGGIVSGATSVGAFLPSERSLCDRYGVDRVTVRRALELLVEDGLVEKKAGLGTRVRLFPPSASLPGDPRTLLFALPRSPHALDRITEPFNTDLFYHMEGLCAAKGYHLVYATLGSDGDLAALAGGNRVGGLFLVSRFPDRLYETCRAEGTPCVVVNHARDGFLCIGADHRKGAYEATAALCRMGHRRIATLAGTPGFDSTEGRLEGFAKALDEVGADARDMPLLRGDWTFGSGYAAMKELLQGATPLPTALFAQNDLMALGAMEAAREAGLSVPGDLSVIGFDDVEQCVYSHPKLSTVHVDIAAIAGMACARLVERVETGEAPECRIVVPTRLVLRGSAAAWDPKSPVKAKGERHGQAGG